MNPVVFLGLILVFILGCQNITEIADSSFPCQQLDWYEIGRASGNQGKPSSDYQTTKANCRDFQDSHKRRFTNGWYAGMDEYCAPLNGFALGRSGRPYEGLCPRSREKDFLAGYKKGQQIFSYETSNLQLSSEMNKLSRSLGDSDSQARKNIEQRLNQLETELELNNALISKIQQELDQSQGQNL